MAPGTPFTDVDKPLHLHITPGACSSEVGDGSPRTCRLDHTLGHTTSVYKLVCGFQCGDVLAQHPV